MDISNGDLLNSAMTEEPVEQAVETVIEQPESGQPRDEVGRYASKAEQAEAEAGQSQEQKGFVPSGRLREEREAREAAERRFSDANAQWERKFNELQARLPQAEKPKAPDVFEDPNGFLQHGVQQAVDPINSQMRNLTEFYSRKEAIREHGNEKITAAYSALDNAAKAGDPEAQAAVMRVKQSMDPYGDMVAWHAKQTVYSQIGNDPNAWFGKELDTKLSDPKFAAEIMQKIQGQLQGQNPQSQNNIFSVPPNLRRAPGARSGSEESGDMSNASLLQAAMR